jgi:hypothetical protein
MGLFRKLLSFTPGGVGNDIRYETAAPGGIL